MPNCNKLIKPKLEHVRLWNDHYYLTRQVIRDAVDSNAYLAIDTDMLYSNQDALGSNFSKLTHRNSANKKLSSLLRIHITIAIEIVKTMIVGKSTDELYEQWQQNGSKIAKTYHRYNRRISYNKMNVMIQTHLETTLAEIVTIVQKDCMASITTGTATLNSIRVMVDYINSKFHR